MARRTWWKVGALLAAMMVFLTMLPVTALADTPSGQVLYVGGVQIPTTGYWTTDSAGKVTQYNEEGKPPNNYIHYDTATNTLTLHNATIKKGLDSNENIQGGTYILGSAIGVFNKNGAAELTITLEGTNTIAEVGKGIYVLANSNGGATLTITGDGSLDASASQTGIWVQSNSGDATLTIQYADVTAENSSSSGDGVLVQAGQSSNASLSVNGGSLTATGSGTDGAGIRFLFGSSDSSSRTPSLTVSGNAMVKASGGEGGISTNSSTATEIKSDSEATSGGIVFNGNEGTVYGKVTLQKDLTIKSGQTLDIPSGASLTIGSDATLTNEGTVTNNGTLTNKGTINNSGTLPDAINGNGTVNHAPTITTDSLPNGTEGTSYSRTLTVTGTAPITWTVSSGSLPTGLSLNGSTGEIAGTPTADGTSTFTIKATNDVGSDSKELSITIDPATLSITTQPSNQSVSEGQTASFSVATTGSGTLTYQWQQSTDIGSSWTDISGATSSSYTTQTATAAMSGYQYRCVVKDGDGNTATSQAATLTVTAATVPVTGVTLNKTSTSLDVGDTETLTVTITPSDATNKNVTWSSDNTSVATVDADGKVTAAGAGTATITVATADGNKTATCVVTVTYPYVPPRPTGPDWGDVADDIADAEPGSTVTVDMDGKTVLPGEVLDELAGRDVTLALDMGGGLIWEIYGGDVPADAEYDDVDLGVALGGDDIPADVVNLVTGESGSVQVSLEHDGPFGFELTLVAPLGEDAAGLVANLYRYDDEAGSLGYEASAQVDNEGVARLPFDHASSWLVALDSRSHALPFSDTAEGEWYSEAVRWVWLSGLMAGYGDGSGAFGTEGVLSRAQLATVLWRQAGEPEAASEASFADCDPGAFYAEAVAWADEAGIIEGYGDGTNFGPEDPVTREQLATILWRAAGEPGGSGDLSGYPDGDDATDYAVPALEWAVGEGVLSGFGDGTLAPDGVLSRAQLAAVLMRLAQEVA